jgi:hypothetical protein
MFASLYSLILLSIVIAESIVTGRADTAEFRGAHLPCVGPFQRTDGVIARAADLNQLHIVSAADSLGCIPWIGCQA